MGGAPSAGVRVAGRRPAMRRGHVVAQGGRREDLDVVAPRQDPQPDLDRAGDRRPPVERAVRLDRRPAATGASAPPGRGRRRPARSGATTSTGSWSAMMSQAARTSPSTTPGSGGSKRSRRQRHVPDPLDLERPDRVARLVEPDEVERVGLERRLDEVRPDAGRPRRRSPGRSGPARSRATTIRRSAQAFVSSRTWWLNRSSRGWRDRTSSVRATCSPSAAGRTSASFSNADARSGSYLSA